MKPAMALTASLLTLLIFSTSCSDGLFSSVPPWLAQARTLEDLLTATAGLANLTLTSGEEKVLLAGLRITEGAPLVVFAVRARLDGSIENRWLLLELEPEAELLDLKVCNSGDGRDAFSLVALFQQPQGGDTARYWRVPSGGDPPKPVEMNLAVGDDGDIAVRDLHLLGYDGADILVYGLDSFAGASDFSSAMVLDKVSENPVILGRYPANTIWEVTLAAPSTPGIAVARSWREEEVFSTDFSLFDPQGAKLAGPQILFTAKYLFSTDFIWESSRNEWTLLWGSSLRYWFQRIAFENGALQRRILPAREIRLGASLVTFAPKSGGYSIVLQDGKRLFSMALDPEGNPTGGRRELVGIGETANRRLHVLAYSWSAGRLALLLSFGGEYHYRLFEP
jgi:hypothetical protein